MNPGSALTAIVLTVGPSGQFDDLQEAVAAAPDGARIEVAPGQYPGPLQLGERAVTIVGTQGADQTVIMGSDDDMDLRVVDVFVAADVPEAPEIVLEGLTLDGAGIARPLKAVRADLVGRELVFRGGVDHDRIGGADVHVESSTLQLSGCKMPDRVVGEFHGGHMAVLDSKLTLSDCGIDNGTTKWFGGGIAAFGSTLALSDVHFGGNDADVGGALYVFSGGEEVTLEDCTFTGNEAVQWGGALTSQGPATIAVRGSRFDDNHAEVDGGAMDVEDAASLLIEDSAFESNDAGIGGALWVGAVGKTSIVRTGFQGNVAERTGGAIHGFRAPITVAGSTFCGNASTTGGALHLGDLTGTVVNSRFQLNEALDGTVLETDGRIGWLHNTATHNGADADGYTLLVTGPYELEVGHSAFVANGGLLFSREISVRRSFNLLWPATVELQPTEISQDPEFVRLEGLCSDDLHPGGGSPLVDGGSPKISEADGTPADIGMYGGVLAPELVDIDGDGVVLGDCEPFDPQAFPGALEQVATGVDEDCDGSEVCFVDADGDGVGGADTAMGDGSCVTGGLSLLGGDCDDTDPTRIEDCDPDDQPVSPQPAVGGLPSPWFCATGSARPLWLAVFLVALVRRSSGG
ncbi:MAG: hypothetical protein KTR31_36615 [Myxococcales bacterium]|nr:hypothetical protein [Myxococcales bacterium]